MTWYEYSLASEGYEIRQEIEWDRTRTLLQMVYNTSDKIKHPIGDRKKLMYLPYIDDNRPKVEIADPEKMRREFMETVKKRLRR